MPHWHAPLSRRFAARAGVLAGLLLGVPLTPSASIAQETSGVGLHATAGVDGVVKAERWTPVRAVVTLSGRELSGDLTVTWGDARVRRAIAFASPGTRTFELYVRTSEPAAAVTVTVQAAGAVAARADVPVRVLPQNEPVSLCVVPPGGGADGGPCTATVATDALPGSVRGYEVIDRVMWPEGVESPDHAIAAASQRAAFREWQAIQALDQAGDLSLTGQVARPSIERGLPASTTRTITAGALAYLALIVSAGVLGKRGRRAGHSYAACAIAILGGSAAALAIGRAGPASAVHVLHASLLQQIPGTAGSLLTIRGIAEFPSADRYALSIPLADGTIEAGASSRRAEELFEEDGSPVLTGAYGLGARQAFTVEGVSDAQPLVVDDSGGRARVTNRSDRVLEDCRFGDGFDAVEPTVLPPNASMTAERRSDGSGPLVTCMLHDEPLVPFRAAGRTVHGTGQTLVVAYRPRPIDGGRQP